MQSIERAFAVLRALAARADSSGVSEVARATGLAKSTTSRILASLEDLGMIDRIGDEGRYAIGAGLATLTGNAVPSGSLRELCRPYLLELAEKSGEGIGLAIADRGQVLYIDHVGSSSPVQIRDWSGTRYPYHTVAAGFALMSSWSDDELAAYASPGMEPFTTQTITSITGLRKKMRQVRGDGVAWTRTEFSDEITGVSAPILDPSGDAIGAISIYGPAWRFPGDRDEGELANLVRDTTHEVSARLVG